MNEHCRMRGTMDTVEEEDDDEEMEAKITTSSSTPPTRALAQLAAKLKQIMGTNTSQVLMSIDPKKQARAPTPIAGLQVTVSKTTQIRPPEGKKTRNDGTPPHKTDTQDATMTKETPPDNKSNTQANTKSLQEQEKPPELQVGEAERTNDKEQQKEEDHLQMITNASLQAPMHHCCTSNMTADTQSDRVNTIGTLAGQMGQADGVREKIENATTKELAPNKGDWESQGRKALTEVTGGSKEDTEQQNDNGRQQPTELSPKEWQNHHDQWLNAVMQNSIGEKKPPEIPDIHTYILVLQPGPDMDINVAPIKTYVTRYDLHIKVEAGENQVELFHQAFCKWFLKLREADNAVIIYPWTEWVRDKEGILIEIQWIFQQLYLF